MKHLLQCLMAIVLTQAVLVAPAQAANDYLLKIDTIEGESTLVGFEKQILANSWSWGLTYASAPVGTGASVGKPIFSDFSWTQGIDRSVVPLFSNLSNGRALPIATLSVVRLSGARPASFFEMVFTDVRLTSLSMSGSGNESAAGSLNYGQLEMRYRPIDAKGGLGSWVSGTFNTRGGSSAATFSGDPNVILGLFESGGNVNLAALPASPVPEPMTWAMLSAGLMTIVLLPRRRRSGAPRR